MGVRFLNKWLLKNCSKESGAIRKQTMYTLSNKVIAVDISIYMYKMMENGPDQLISNMRNMFKMLQFYKITPIFVFDGKPPIEKFNVMQRRKQEKKLAEDAYNTLYNSYMEYLNNTTTTATTTQPNTLPLWQRAHGSDDINIESIYKTLQKLRGTATFITPHQILLVQKLILEFGFKYLIATAEADEMCATLVHQGVAWACMSDDMDMIVYGCPRIIRCLNLKGHSFMFYTMENVLAALDMTQETLCYLCILCGTDYELEHISQFKNDKDRLAYFHQITDLYGVWHRCFRKTAFADWISQNDNSNLNINRAELDTVYNMFNHRPSAEGALCALGYARRCWAALARRGLKPKNLYIILHDYIPIK